MGKRRETDAGRPLQATQIHLLLATPVVVLDAAVRAANTAGVRVLNMLAVCVCMCHAQSAGVSLSVAPSCF